MYDNSVSRLLREARQHEEVRKRLLGGISAVDWRLIGEMNYKHDALRQAVGLGWFASDYAAFTRDTQELLGGISLGAGLQTAISSLLADRMHLMSSFSHSFLASVQMTEAITRVHNEATRIYGFNLTSGLAGLGALQEAAAQSAGMSAMIEESVDLGELKPQPRRLFRGVGRLARRSTLIWDDLADDVGQFDDVPQRLRQSPVVQVFEATRSTGLILTQNTDLIDVAPPPGILVVEAGELQEALQRLHPALAEAYIGAVETFERRGNDYIRQVSASLRELLKHLLEILAPENEIRRWDVTVLPTAGKMTDKARLQYVFRGSSTIEAYAGMTARDIDHILQSFFPLNGGVHRLEAELQHEQMRSLFRRCEYNIVTILDAHTISLRVS